MTTPTLPRSREPTHPRLAERRREVRRHASRRKKALLVALGVVSVLAAVSWPLLHSRFFSARVITVLGAVHTSRSQILAAAGLSGHPPMIDVHSGQAASRVEALPWVASATVARHFPDAVTVTVRERRAVAVVSDGTGWAELDATGRVLADLEVAPSGLARVVSVGRPGIPGSTMGLAHQLVAVASALPVALAPLVTAISPSPGGGVDLSLSDGVGVVLGPPSSLPAKFEDVASILAGAQPAPGSVIDVSVPPSPAVVPPKTAGPD